MCLREINILMIVYNPRRCLTIWGIDGFRKRLKEFEEPFSKQAAYFVYLSLCNVRCAEKRNRNFV